MKPLFSPIAQFVLLAICWIALLGEVHGQEEIILHSFGDGSVTDDGKAPSACLIHGFDGDYYGTTALGGSVPGPSGNDGGTVFRMSPQGQVTILHNFTGNDSGPPIDGANPLAALVQGSNGNFYGSTHSGGSANAGTLFKITPQGQLKIVHHFLDGGTAHDGSLPNSGMVQGSDGNFYGTTKSGGSANQGTVFKMTPQGLVTTLHSFGDGSVPNDGTLPTAALIQASDGNFYGTTTSGGSANQGAVFKITLLGQVTILHSFGDSSVAHDGASPSTSLIQGSDGNLYGTTGSGGSANHGIVFKMTLAGQLTILHSFGDGSVANDGAGPNTSLIQGLDGNFYGTTGSGGSANLGVVFKMTPQGQLTIFHSFGDGSVANDGTNPNAGLLQDSSGNFYGTTSGGGSAGLGTIFKLVPVLPNITSAVNISGTVAVPLTYQTTGTNKPTHFTAVGLPDGLSIDTRTGAISGTPTTQGASTVSLTLTNSAGSNTFPLTITIAALPAPAITSILTAFGSVGTPFQYTPLAAFNPASYGAMNLPPGLNINMTTGIISGTPTTAGVYPVSLSATNTAGPTTVTLSISIFNSPPTLSQEYVVLHRFNDGSVPDDGRQPSSILQGFNGAFYGATTTGGSNGFGAVFQMSVQGTTSIVNSAVSGGLGQDFAQASDGNFYGTNFAGGPIAKGFAFKLTPQGVATILHFFGDGSVANDGANPSAGLIQASDGNFYGTTKSGGTADKGTIFKMTPTGAVTILHHFGDGGVTNDGQNPENGLIQGLDGNFYGTTQNGGSNGLGSVFKVTPQGAVSILHSFGDNSVPNDGLPGSSNGLPRLVEGTDGNFYGVTAAGGSAGQGCAYQITPAGVITILHSFAGGTVTNDGAQPLASLIVGFDGNFYGTTQLGGSASLGTVFAMTPTGTVTIIHHFGDGSVANDGTGPIGGLRESSDGNFYGTTSGGGTGFGTVFQIVAMQAPIGTPVTGGSATITTDDGDQTVYAPGVELYLATSWTLTGTLPPGLIFDPSSGTITGTPLATDPPGTTTVTITSNNGNGSGTSIIVTIIIGSPPSITSPATANGVVGTPLTYTITASNTPTSFSATNLPAWLSANHDSGIVTGTPPSAGAYAFDLTATNAVGSGVEHVTLTVTGGPPSVPTMTNPLTASGTQGTLFTYSIPAANSPNKYSALSVPTTLSFDPASGNISGIPTVAGTFMIPVTATNGAGTFGTVLNLTITPVPAPVLSGPLSASGVLGAAFFYQIPATGTVSDYGATGLPAGLLLNSSTGVISGTPTATGPFSVALTAGNGTGTSMATLTLTISASTLNFGEWEQSLSFTGTQTETPFNDGVPNLLKFLFHINPTAPISATDRAALPTLGTTTIGGTEYLTLTYRQYTLESNITVNVQTSSDLQTWQTVDPPDLSQQIGTDANTGDPIIEVGVQETGSSKQFIRLNVTSP